MKTYYFDLRRALSIAAALPTHWREASCLDTGKPERWLSNESGWLFP